MTVILVIMAAAVGAFFGSWHEYYTGRFDHVVRRISKPTPPVTHPRSHDDFIDDCEQFNRAMITTPLDQRVLLAPDTVQ